MDNHCYTELKKYHLPYSFRISEKTGVIAKTLETKIFWEDAQLTVTGLCTTRRPEFALQQKCKKKKKKSGTVLSCNPSTWEGQTIGPWVSLARQHGITDELSAK